MEYVKLGWSGLAVSRVSLGSWLTYGNVVDQGVSDRIVGRAVELGINLLDTADVYNRGEGEIALGKAIGSMRRQWLVIASKCFFPMSDDVNDRGLSRKHIVESVHRSLQRLGTDYLDLYQCHRHDPTTPLLETVMAMDDLVRQGKILYWGVSEWPAAAIEEAVELCRANGLHAPISNQPRYNLMDREIEAEVIPTCARIGVGQIVFSPLAQGVLTGKYRPGVSPDRGTRAGNSRVNMFIGRYLEEERLRRVQRFVELAKRHDISPAQLALAFCMREPNVNSVIIGATSVEQLEENAMAGEVELSEPVLAELGELFPR